MSPTPTRMVTIKKKKKISSIGKNVEKLEPLHSGGGGGGGSTTMKNNMEVLK